MNSVTNQYPGEPTGFTTVSGDTPTSDNVEDWLVWHLTHVDNLERIVTSGALLSFKESDPSVRIALTTIQQRRSSVIIKVPSGPSGPSGHPAGKSLHDHVPFYFAARSPMQFLIAKGHADFKGGNRNLILIGVRIGSIIERNYTWCFSDRNATIAGAQFRSNLDEIPELLSLDILGRKYWNDSPEINASERRQAEFLILDHVKVSDFNMIVTQNPHTLATVRQTLLTHGYQVQADCYPGFYFEEG